MSDDENDFDDYYDQDDGYYEEHSEVEYSDTEADVEDQYFTSKALKEDSLEEALESFQKVLELEGSDKGEWGFKALKQMMKINFKLGKFSKMMKCYKQLLTYIASAVTQKYSEKSISSILHYISTSNEVLLLQDFYEATLERLKEVKNDWFWFRINIKLGKLYFDREEFEKLKKVLNQLHEFCLTEDGEDDLQKGKQLLEIYALGIQMYTAKKKSKKLRAMYEQSLHIRCDYPNPLNIGVIRECGGKMHMREGDYDNAYTDFFEAFKHYEEAGNPRRTITLKYLLLASMYMKPGINLFDAQEVKAYKNDPEIVAMTNLVNAYQSNDIHEFEMILKDNKWNIMEDSFIRKHIRKNADYLRLIRKQVLIKIFDSSIATRVKQSYDFSIYYENHLAIYNNFEYEYLKSRKDYYNARCHKYLAANGIRDYMVWAEAKLKEEKKRAKKFLKISEKSTSMATFMDIFVQIIIASFKDSMLGVAEQMISNNETENTALMFRLINRIPGDIDPIRQYLERQIINQGLAVMQLSMSNPEQYVEKLMDLFYRFNSLVKNAFRNDTRFLMSRDEAYHVVVNDTSVFDIKLPTKNSSVGAKTQPESKCPELLANFCDLLFRRSSLSKKLTSEEMKQKAKDVVDILKYVRNRDIFMRYYKTHLARRLILRSSIDFELEENMIYWLKDVGISAQYIQTLQRMFQDIKLGMDFNDKFKDAHREKNEFMTNDVNFNVFSSCAWARRSDRLPVTLPTEIAENIPHMEEYYTKQFNGRKLQWYHMMSNGTINFVNDVGKFELEVTTYQMAILFLWNGIPTEKISFEVMRMSTELPANELKRSLFYLAMNPKLKHQLLLCSLPGRNPKEFTNDTQFWVNHKFGIVKGGKLLRRGKMSLIGKLQLSSEANKKEDEDAIIELRKFRVQEALVKIMKMHRIVTNTQLWTELIDTLKKQFVPSKEIVKEQIEWLIENKYMERDPNKRETFRYLT